jgi:protein-ribulosamine 3-kinase
VNRWSALTRELAASGVRCAPAPERRVGGGSVGECYAWPCDEGALFVKVGPPAAAAAFAAEAAGLAELAGAHALRVPRVVACGHAASQAFLALEWIETGPASAECERRLGEGLAALHAVTARRFGWRCDNTIGPTPQANTWSRDWTEFFRERRLRPQLALAVQNGLSALLGARGERLLESVDALLGAHRPQPSLLHGDLWGGNWLASPSGEPVIFDPAVYYGDREADIAMTRLFGGFGEAFHQAYEAAAPLPQGTRLRQNLYNLYHVLNHANLFGGGYPQQAARMIDRLLAEVRG